MTNILPFSQFERDLPQLVERCDKEKGTIKGVLVLFEYENGDTDAHSYGNPDIRMMIGEMSGVEHRFWEAVQQIQKEEGRS